MKRIVFIASFIALLITTSVFAQSSTLPVIVNVVIEHDGNLIEKTFSLDFESDLSDVSVVAGEGITVSVQLPTPTVEPVTLTGAASQNANLRSGPGTQFEIVGSVSEGETFVILSSNDDGSWYKLREDTWLSASLVQGVSGVVPTVAAITPSSSPTPAATLQPTRTLQSTSTPRPTNTSRSTQTPRPTRTPMPTQTIIPVSTELPIPTDDLKSSKSQGSASDTSNGYMSGGLGLSKNEWEQNHVKTTLEYFTMGTGYDNKYDVSFQVDNVWMIESLWSADSGVTLAPAEVESQKLIPSDSQLVETYSPEGRPEAVVNLYYSESLKDRFQNEDREFGNWWTGGEPGNFIVLFKVFDDEVHRMIIATGNNP